MLETRSLAKWKDLVILLVQRDLRVRYRGSFLGYVWSMMNPLLYMAILSFVFSHLMRVKIENYAAFILSGTLTWNLFHQSLMIGVNSILGNGALLRKVQVPAALFPAVSVCSVLVNFVLALGPYVLIALATGVQLTPWILALPLVIVPYLIFIYGLALFVGTMNISFRDVGHTLEPLLTMLFYASPIVYPVEMLPESYRKLLWLNPMTPFLTEMRSLLFYGRAPSAQGMTLIFALAFAAFVLGVLVYRKNRDGFVYNL